MHYIKDSNDAPNSKTHKMFRIQDYNIVAIQDSNNTPNSTNEFRHRHRESAVEPSMGHRIHLCGWNAAGHQTHEHQIEVYAMKISKR